MKRIAYLLILCIFFSAASGKVRDSRKYLLVNGVGANDESFKEVRDVLGNSHKGNILPGVGFIISYLRLPPDEAAAELRQYLSLSEKYDLPVIVQLDGEQWWNNRPDLWNWWDPSKPGYAPENKKNVEWTNWSPDSAVKIGWRNWGRQIRVLPMPNLMSPVYREACHIEMKKLVPIVMSWWERLPGNKKYLLAGIKMGWESAIGVNNWYYPHGNDLLDKAVAEDPEYGLKTGLLPDRGVKSIGYAAVSTLGLAQSGTLKEEHLTEVVRRHLDDLCKLCADLGVPRDRLFTHCGGWSQGETLYSAALNEFSCPGWSFYKYAADPKKDVTAMTALEKSDAPYWAAVEWLFQGKNTQEEWSSALRKSLGDDRIRYMCIYNWGGIRKNEAAIAAINKFLKNSK